MTYVGYKIPRYSLGSTPWGTLAASNGSVCSVGQKGPSWRVAIPMGYQDKASGFPGRVCKHQYFWASKVGRAHPLSQIPHNFSGSASGRSPRTTHRASTILPLMGCRPLQAMFSPGTCTWILTLGFSFGAPQFLSASEIEMS